MNSVPLTTKKIKKEDIWDVEETVSSAWPPRKGDYLQGASFDPKKEPFFFFINGMAGTGKSVLLKALRSEINKTFEDHGACQVFAPTGASALLVGGRTIHSGFFISTKEGSEFEPLEKGTLGRIRKDLKGLKVVIIDELSLPAWSTRAPQGVDNLWTLFRMLTLSVNMRTSDPEEARALAEIRKGEIEKETELFLQRKMWFPSAHTIEGIADEVDYLRTQNPGKSIMLLAGKNRTVDELNAFVSSCTRSATESFVYPRPNDEKRVETAHFAKRLELLLSCKVVLTTTIKKAQGLVNGAIGEVKAFNSDSVTVQFPTHPHVRIERVEFCNGKDSWSQFPLRVAEAMTIHSSQGKTFDGVVIVVRESTQTQQQKEKIVAKCPPQFSGMVP
ncbi:unnamed protein product [Caenorhabditis sp. 36 PRJEB53466]|nr:unnamed protein product [Caenorhabditis sp. 36 PRJEB53466]